MYKGSTKIWEQTIASVPVSSGVFSVILTGDATWPLDTVAFNEPIDLGVKVGTDTEMTPRTPLTSVAYALGLRGLSIVHAEDASNRIAPNLIGGASNNYVAPGIVGATIGGGGGFDENVLVPDSVLGRWGTVGGGILNAAGPHGTVGGGAQNRALNSSVVAGGLRNLATGYATAMVGGQDNSAENLESFVGGGSHNKATGDNAVVVGGSGNEASGLGSSIGGGFLNSAAGDSAAVGGGHGNTASGLASAIAGGGNNTASAAHSTIGGGHSNEASGDWSTVGGGRENVADNYDATVGGGFKNTASEYWATVGGGESNKATGSRSTIGGGSLNTASALYATVPGGLRNSARGSASFAAGYNARADHDGSFVWNDRSQTLSNHADSLYTTAENQFLIRAAGGVGIGTNKPKRGLTISRDAEASAYQLELRNVGEIQVGSFDGIAFTQQDSGQTELASIKAVYQNNGYPDMSFSLRAAPNLLYLKNAGDMVGIGTTSPTEKLEVNGNVLANNVVVPSDRRLKRDIQSLNNSLTTIGRLQGVSYAWRIEEYPDRAFDDGRHLGFIAQDVEAVVPEVVNVGSDGTYSLRYQEIIPLLVEAIKEQQATISAQNERIEALEARLTN